MLRETMASSRASSRISYLIAFSLISAAFAATPSLCPFEYLYQFGDSLADTGNRIRLPCATAFCSSALRLPYGMTYFHKPTGRFSNGLLVIDFIAKALHLPLLPPYLETNASLSHGADFAVAGSTALDNSFFAERNITVPTSPNIPLSQQLQWFKKHLTSVSNNESKRKARLRRALIIMGETGGNDINYALSYGSKSIEEIKKTFVPCIIESISNAVREAIQLGAVYIVVPGSFPSGCLPIILTRFPSTDPNAYDDKGCLRKYNKFDLFFKNYLQTSLASLRLEFPDVVIHYFDSYKAFESILHRANFLGFNRRPLVKACCGIGGKYNYDAKKMCGSQGVKACDNPAEFISWDGVHLTQQAYYYISEILIQEVLSKINCRSSDVNAGLHSFI